MNRIVLISNRLPVTIRTTREGDQDLVRSSGGLVAGLDPLHRGGNSLWIGYPGEVPDESTTRILQERRLISVGIPLAEMRSHYQGYANSAIWPLFHYMIERCSFSNREFEVYRSVNARFADVVASHATEDDTIWVHDYHLMLLPAMLRERIPRARIGFFLHTPFPAPEVYRILPQRREILEGLLGADLLGVHTYDYALHLARSIRRVLGAEVREGAATVDGRSVRIEAHPMGVDAEQQHDIAYSGRAERRLRALRKDMAGRQVILGVDRLDYTKGLPLKLAAFRTLLASSNRWRGSVVLVQVAVPSRTAIESYRRQKQEVDRLVGEINGAYGLPGRFPIHYIYRSIPPEELGALYRLADVAFVAPLRDGLNLVAKEYVACRDDGSGGVLVLSEFAGASSELGEALHVNPSDVEGTAAVLERALEMDYGERNERMAAMHRRVMATNVHQWAERFLKSLSSAPAPRPRPPVLPPDELLEELSPGFASAESSLILLDYDGTLREFTAKYDEAVPTSEILSILDALAALPGVSVVINSGRDKETLFAWLGRLPISIVAEHGAWGRFAPDGQWERIGSGRSATWKNGVRSMLQEYVARTPGTRLEEKDCSLVWHYREAAGELSDWQAREATALLEDLLANELAEVVVGDKIVEVRQAGVHKGMAYTAAETRLGPFDFTLAVGDDRTDEDLFRTVGDDAKTIKIGAGPSAAQVALQSPADLRALLRGLVDLRQPR